MMSAKKRVKEKQIKRQIWVWKKKMEKWAKKEKQRKRREKKMKYKEEKFCDQKKRKTESHFP